MPTKHHPENKNKVGSKNMGKSGQSDRRHQAMVEMQKENLAEKA